MNSLDRATRYLQILSLCFFLCAWLASVSGVKAAGGSLTTDFRLSPPQIYLQTDAESETVEESREVEREIEGRAGELSEDDASPVSEKAASNLIYVIPIRDDITPPLTYLVRRGVKEAIREGAELLVLDMETNGGRVDVTTEIIEILEQFPGKTATFVNKKAFSAGAFISVATQKIYMAPGSVIGAAAPIMVSPGSGAQEMPNTMEVKMTSAISAMIRAQCQKNGHDADVIEAMIDKSQELILDDEILCEKGQILTLTDSEALQEYGDPARPLLSAGTLEDLDQVFAEMGFSDARVVRVEPTGAEQMGRWINMISPILLLIGLAGVYLEFKTPGFGFPGMVGLISLMFYFFGAYISGISGLGWAIVFLIGLILLIIEVFLIPGTFISGIVGVVMMAVALVMAMVDLYPVAPQGAEQAPATAEESGSGVSDTQETPETFGFNVVLPDSSSVTRAFLQLAFASLGAIGLVYALGYFMRNTDMYHHLISESASGRDESWETGLAAKEGIGSVGTALSPLRPGGKARIDGKIVDVIADGQMIEAGARVRVLRHSGMEAVVEQVED